MTSTLSQTSRPSQSPRAGQARPAHREYERAQERLAGRRDARARTRQRQAIALAGLVGAFILAGATTGTLMALQTVQEAPRAASMPRQPPSARASLLPSTVPATKIYIAPEVEEAVLARLYEEPLDAAEAPTPEPGEHAQTTAVELASLALLNLPAVAAPWRPLWERNAVPVAAPAGRPMIAIVIDDLGLNRPGTRRAIALPGPLTLSFMTYAEDLSGLAHDARDAGHELLLHVPMEPRNADYDPGPKVLAGDLSADELQRRLQWGLARFEGFVGINNHMGSKFTTSVEGLALVMSELKSRGLLFLDSLTAPGSVGWLVASKAGVPYAQRDVFLDNDWRDRTAIRRQIAKLEQAARARGYAVGIGHPHRVTLDVLAEWLPEARRRGFVLVPISAIVRHRTAIAQKAIPRAG